MQTSEINNNIEIKDSNVSEDSVQINYFPTVFDAIRASGGVTEYADLSRVEILRVDSLSNKGGMKKTTLNLLQDGDDIANNQNIRIYSGDIINVPRSEKKLSIQFLIS